MSSAAARDSFHSPSISRGGSPDDDRNDEDGFRLQSNRACDACHRLKMKCIGKENPPCNRCLQSGQQCTFNGPRKSKASKVEDRLKFMEDQITAIQSSLSELISLQRAALGAQLYQQGGSAARPMPPQEPSAVSTPPPAPPHPPPPTHLSRLEGYVSSPLRQLFDAPPSRDPNPFPPHRTDDSNRPSSAVAVEYSGPSDEEDDDPLEPSAVIFNNMLSLAEAARLKADGHYGNDSDPQPNESKKSARKEGSPDASDKRPHKRRRKSEAPELRVMSLQKPNYVHPFPDCIQVGLVSEAKSRQLFEAFMERGNIYVPIFEPEVDTWESVRQRSPFLMSVMIMVGSKVEDAGGQPSELHKKLKTYAEQVGSNTLFTPVSQIEVLQAMILLASWGDTSWRPGGHALRMGMDMGLYRCMPYLAQARMGRGRAKTELNNERPLVVGARCWLALYKIEFEMAFNLGRPALFAAEETIKHCRWFLEHPMSIQTDTRLVSSCELLTLRLPMHQSFSVWSTSTRIPVEENKIQEANGNFVNWYRYWDDYYSSRGVPKTSLLRESLITQYSHSVLQCNCRILHGLRSPRDLASLSEARQEQLKTALHCAETLVRVPLQNPEYARTFVKANHFTHVGVAFAARLLIRMASLMPEAVSDLRQTAKDLEALAKFLAQDGGPGVAFAQQIREIVIRARRKHLFPPESPGSPGTSTSTAPPTAEEATPDSITNISGLTTGTGSGNSAFQPLEGFPADFYYGASEQLFSIVPGLQNFQQPMLAALGVAQPAQPSAPTYNLLDALFPFPQQQQQQQLEGVGFMNGPQAQEEPEGAQGGPASGWVPW